MRRVGHARTLQQRLVVAGEQPLGVTVVADREGLEVGLEEGAGLSRCGCLCTPSASSRPCRRERPGRLPACRRPAWPPSAAEPERRERCLGTSSVQPDKSVKSTAESFRTAAGGGASVGFLLLGTGAEKYQARKEKRCAAHGVRQDDAPVSTSCQFGSRERVSRSKVHRSTTVSIWRESPSTTSPAVSRVRLICSLVNAPLREPGCRPCRPRPSRRHASLPTRSTRCGPPARGRRWRRRTGRTPRRPAAAAVPPCRPWRRPRRSSRMQPAPCRNWSGSKRGSARRMAATPAAVGPSATGGRPHRRVASGRAPASARHCRCRGSRHAG